MTESEFREHFPSGSLYSEVDCRASRIVWPAWVGPAEHARYSGEVFEASSLAKALNLKAQSDLVFKGGLIYRDGPEPEVRAYFWRVAA